MFSYLFTFQTLTAAQRARCMLRAAKRNPRLTRAPAEAARHGCQYALIVKGAEGLACVKALRAASLPYEKLYLLHPDGSVREAEL